MEESMKRREPLSRSMLIAVLFVVLTVMVFIGCENGGEDGKGTLYVGGYNTGKIYVIDADLEELVTTIDLPEGAQPDWLTLSPDNTKLYCSSSSQNRVYIIDATTDTYDKEVIVCPSPQGIAFTPDGTKAAVGCFYDLSIIDVATGTYVNNDVDATIRGFSDQINGMEVHPTNNHLYAALSSGSVMYAPVAGTDAVDTYAVGSGSESLLDVAISIDGSRLYVSENARSNIEIADISSGDGSLAYNGVVTNPSAYYGRLTLSPNGARLYASRYCASRIDYMSTSGTPSMSSFDIQYDGNNYGQKDIALSEGGSVAFVLVGHTQFHTIVILDTTSGSQLGTIELPQCQANSIVYKP
jgi:YVTN family beta-propeller protein